MHHSLKDTHKIYPITQGEVYVGAVTRDDVEQQEEVRKLECAPKEQTITRGGLRGRNHIECPFNH